MLSIPYVDGPATTAAWEELDSWWAGFVDSADGPAAQLPVIALTGVEGAGKTRLLIEWLNRHEGMLIELESRGNDDRISATAAIDDADSWSALSLFSEINEAISSRRPLILSGKDRPVKWVSDPTAPGAPDLLSRLQSIQTIELEAPDEDTLVKALNSALFSAGLDLPLSTIRPIASKLCRRFSAVQDVALSALQLSPSIAAPKALLEAAIADNPRHCLTP